MQSKNIRLCIYILLCESFCYEMKGNTKLYPEWHLQILLSNSRMVFCNKIKFILLLSQVMPFYRMHTCSRMTKCRRDSPIRLHKVNCSVDDYVVCLGSRTFYKKVECNWTSGYKKSTTLILSIFLGGFGVDRFYLGLYRVIIKCLHFLSFFLYLCIFNA